MKFNNIIQEFKPKQLLHSTVLMEILVSPFFIIKMQKSDT
jgi:hypothetical protein